MAKKEKELEFDIPRKEVESEISSLLDSLSKARETQDKQNQLLERIAIAIEELADKF